MPATSMRVLTWKWAPTWMTLGTQYSSMLLNCGRHERTCVHSGGGGKDRQVGFDARGLSPRASLPSRQVLGRLTGQHECDEQGVL